MLVLDANILIRAVLGSRVLGILHRYAEQVDFMAPDVAFQEAQEHLPGILAARKTPIEPAIATLDLLAQLVQRVEAETYAPFEAVARERIDRRDVNDWPVLASALALGCPIWTEDADFFGCGVATWRRGPRTASNCTYRGFRASRFDGQRAWAAQSPEPLGVTSPCSCPSRR